jgi:hypothetical protein
MQPLAVPKNPRPAQAFLLFLVFYLFTYNSSQFAQEYSGRESVFSGASAREEENAHYWVTITSGYFAIYLEPEVNLKRVLSRINTRGFYTPGPRIANPLAGTEEKIAYRMDLLLKRVEKILDIYPEVRGVKIKIFKSRSALQDEFRNITGRREFVKSFYVHRHKTIYASEADISDSVVAHEMGHMVVDHYFQAVPSEKVGETLATYVDLHLDED